MVKRRPRTQHVTRRATRFNVLPRTHLINRESLNAARIQRASQSFSFAWSNINLNQANESGHPQVAIRGELLEIGGEHVTPVGIDRE